jgi:hypothetical protein
LNKRRCFKIRILYLSCHSILEFDELSLLTELEGELSPDGGVTEVFSMGAYTNPTQSGDYKRSVIPKGVMYPHLYDVAMQCDKDRIHPELLEWADVIVMMHNSRVPGQTDEQPWVVRNWDTIKRLNRNNRTVWRSIGQSTPAIERELSRFRPEGLKLLRYSPLEEKLPNYAGADGMIRFAKDEQEFSGWTGERQQVMALSQSFKKRGAHLGFSVFDKVTGGMNRKVYGSDNEDLGEMFGGSPSFHELQAVLRQNRVFFYFGTIPAPYTLGFIEAMMTGIPVVAVGKQLRRMDAYHWENYEVPDIIVNGVNGYVSDDINQLRGYIQNLLDDQQLAKSIGEAGRQTALGLFGKRQRMQEWSDFLRKL